MAIASFGGRSFPKLVLLLRSVSGLRVNAWADNWLLQDALTTVEVLPVLIFEMNRNCMMFFVVAAQAGYWLTFVLCTLFGQRGIYEASNPNDKSRQI